VEIPRINADRFRRDFDALARIGATGDGGVHRPALTEPHIEARSWWRDLIVSDGLGFGRDGAGNHSARLECRDPDARTLLIGSHLDSVPYGGRFDGALGVLAAHEVLRAVRDARLSPRCHLEAIDFTDEEGTLVGLLGSRALAGSLPREELAAPRGGREALEAGYSLSGINDDTVVSSRRAAESLAGFLELHIEQGPRLASAGVDIGIVSAIVGMGSAELGFRGQADHAGTTPLAHRRDAGLAAARTMACATARVKDSFPECVINFGRVDFQPGAYNIVPGTATLAVEYRASDTETMAGLKTLLFDVARECAAECGVEIDIRPRGVIQPSPCSSEVRGAFAAACDRLDLKHVELASGAGHDTMALAAVCPAGMIFIPSTGGSHSPREFADWEACVRGADTLLHATLQLGGA
jgi:N-carbamoyl-L-amino-acid hydrolase